MKKLMVKASSKEKNGGTPPLATKIPTNVAQEKLKIANTRDRIHRA